MAPGYGVFTVMPAWPDPFLGEVEVERTQDTQKFFDEETSSEERRSLMDKYGARWVLADPKHLPLISKDPNFKKIAVRPQRATGSCSLKTVARSCSNSSEVSFIIRP